MDSNSVQLQIELWRNEISKRHYQAVGRSIKIIEMNEATAIRLVIYCCKSVCSETAELSAPILATDDLLGLYELLKRITKRVTKFSEANSDKYLQALYHIMRAFLNTGYVELFSKMEEILMPQCLCQTSKTKELFKSMCSILYKHLIRCQDQDKCSQDHNFLIILSRLITLISERFLDCNFLINISFQCFSTLRYMEIGTSSLSSYYFFVIERLGTKTQDMQFLTEHELSQVGFMLCTIMHAFLEKSDYDGCEKFFNKSKLVLQAYKDLSDLHTILRVCMFFYPIEYKNKIKEMGDWPVKLKALVNTKAMGMFHNIGDCVIYELQAILRYYKNVIINNDLSENTLEKMLDCAKTLSSHVKVSKKDSCECTSHNCFVVYDLLSRFHPLILNFIEKRGGTNISTKFGTCITSWFTDCSEFVYNINTSNCKRFWDASKNFADYFYSTAMRLYEQKYVDSLKICKSFLTCLFKIDFESSKHSSRVKHILQVLREDAWNKEAYEEALFFFALRVFVDLEVSVLNTTNFLGGVKTKIKSNEDFQKITLVTALSKCKQYFKDIESFIRPTTKDKILLLTLELRYYKLKWASKVPMMAAFRELYKYADLDTVCSLVIEIFGDGYISIHNELHDTFDRIRRKCKVKLEQSSDKNKFCSAVLNLYQYKYLKGLSIKKNTEEVEKHMANLNDVQNHNDPDPVPKDPTDRSDIVPTYEDLSLDKFMDSMKYINEALNLLSSIRIPNSQDKEIKIICNLLLDIFYEYRLQCFELKGIKALNLCLHYANIIDDPYMKLLCISFVIEHNCSRTKITQTDANFIATGDKLVECLKQQPSSVSVTKAILMYYICRAKAYLQSDLHDLAFDTYRCAEKLYKKQVDTDTQKVDFSFVKAQLQRLKYHLYLPCEKNKEHLEHSVMLCLHMAADTCLSRPLTNVYEQSVTFETIQELTKAYYFLRLPRELTRQTSNSALLSQKLVIPLRVAWFLVYLSHADLLRNRLDSCLVKLNGIHDILYATKCVEMSRKSNANIKTSNNAVEGLRLKLEEMVLDVPQYQYQLSPSSPPLHVESFKIPLFLSHSNDCECFYCNSLEYHQLLLQTTVLNALVNAVQKRTSLANDFFEKALNFYKILHNNYPDFKTRNAKYMPTDVMPDFEDYFMETYGYLLLNYSSHLDRENRFEDAKTINNDLILMLRPQKRKHMFLYTETLMQTCSYLLADECREGNAEAQHEDKNVLCVENSGASNDATTPESKLSEIRIPKVSPYSELPCRKMKKPQRLVFDSPGMPPPEDDVAHMLKKKGMVKKRDKSVTETPLQTKCKSAVLGESNPVSARKRTAKVVPATPNIRIFADNKLESCTKTSLKENVPHKGNINPYESPQFDETAKSKVKINLQKRLMLENPEHVASCLNSGPSSEVPDSSDLNDVVSVSPEACTYPAASSLLKSRTKKLTQKLKESTSKPVPSACGKHEMPPQRKNLLADFNACTPVIRKSTRNKKVP